MCRFCLRGVLTSGALVLFEEHGLACQHSLKTNARKARVGVWGVCPPAKTPRQRSAP